MFIVATPPTNGSSSVGSGMAQSAPPTPNAAPHLPPPRRQVERRNGNRKGLSGTAVCGPASTVVWELGEAIPPATRLSGDGAISSVLLEPLFDCPLLSEKLRASRAKPSSQHPA